MRNRLFYVLVLTLMLASFMAASYGFWQIVATRNPAALALGVTGIVASRAMYLYGVDHAEFNKYDNPRAADAEAWESVLEQDFAADIADELRNDPILLARLLRLRRMEGELAELQAHYNEPGFDAWKVQEHRTRIASLLREDRRLEDFRRDSIASYDSGNDSRDA